MKPVTDSCTYIQKCIQDFTTLTKEEQKNLERIRKYKPKMRAKGKIKNK